MPGGGPDNRRRKTNLTIHGDDSEHPFYVQSGASLTLHNLAIDLGDTNIGDGGGLYGIGEVTLLNCTFSDNEAGSGGGIYSNAGTFIQNTIVANSPLGGNCLCHVLCSALALNQGNNIDSGASCGFESENGSMSSTNPLLDALKNNGGPTRTMGLPTGSPARDGVNWNAPNGCPESDQRGSWRPFGDFCDIGAFKAGFYIFLPLVRKN